MGDGTYSSGVLHVEAVPARSALDDYYARKQGVINRKRQSVLDMPPHLRPTGNPLTHGCMANYKTATQCALERPPQMATDPKWSTELKRMNNRIGQRAKYFTRVSASVPGSLSPEFPYMPPKDYLSCPPTPYFEAGKTHGGREMPKYFITARSHI